MRGQTEAHRPYSEGVGGHDVAASSALNSARAGFAGVNLPRYQQRFPEHLTAFEIVERPPDEGRLADGLVQSRG